MKGFIIVLCVLLGVGLLIYCGVASWMLSRDTTAILERAQVAANAADMLDYVSQLEENMSERGMTEGYAAVVFKTPYNDMSLIYKSLTKIRERLVQVKDLPQADTTYQVALDDLRGTLRELDVCASGWFWARKGWWLLLIAAVGFGLAMLLEFLGFGDNW